MSDLTVARRYAQALIEQAEASGSVETTDQDVALLRESIQESADLGRFFQSPIISREKKKAVVESLFGERVSSLTLRTLHLLVDKRREGQVSDVLAAYRDVRNAQLGIVDVTVRSARSLSEADRKAIADALEKRLGKQARLEVSVDAALIGGIVVKVGDTVYDGSVSNRLASLRERMMESTLMN